MLKSMYIPNKQVKQDRLQNWPQEKIIVIFTIKKQLLKNTMMWWNQQLSKILLKIQ